MRGSVAIQQSFGFFIQVAELIGWSTASSPPIPNPYDAGIAPRSSAALRKTRCAFFNAEMSYSIDDPQ